MRDEFSRILVAVDGSDLSKKAMRKALKLSKASNIPVAAIHVLDLPFMPDITTAETDIPYQEVSNMLNLEAERIFSDVKAQAKRQDLEVETLLAKGHVAQEIVKQAKTTDLLIIGSKGRGIFERVLLGSVAENVIHHANCPVMVVK